MSDDNFGEDVPKHRAQVTAMLQNAMAQAATRTLSVEEIKRYLREKKADRPCEACGDWHWNVMREDQHRARSVLTFYQFPGYDRVSNVDLVTIACGNCGGVRSFLREPIKRWLATN